ncbi:MAG: 50S ribosomal protein L4 [Candidatus Cloacimonadota bacterium]|nr:50S ribosomal protein L4 [Candidatus Cloacimonadota bacterium]
MEAIKYSKIGEKIEEIKLPENLFDAEVNEAVLHEVVTMYHRNQRQGTKSTKSRSDVKCSGRKLYRQKGTGRARAGDAGSPTRVGGGVAFAHKPKNWTKKIPKKKKRLALRSALSSKNEHIFIVEDFDFEKASTKQANEIIKKMDIGFRKCLLLMPDNSSIVRKSFGNLKNFQTSRAQDVHPYLILNSSDIIITENALKMMEETFHE